MKRIVRRRPRLPASLRALAALALALLVADHVLPALHHAFVVHELCPEHGLEHADARLGNNAPEENGPSVDRGSTDAGHHHGCSSVPASPPRAPVVGAAVAVIDLAFVEPDSTTIVSVPVPPADVVAFAPKQSPPA